MGLLLLTHNSCIQTNTVTGYISDFPASPMGTYGFLIRSVITCYMLLKHFSEESPLAEAAQNSSKTSQDQFYLLQAEPLLNLQIEITVIR